MTTDRELIEGFVRIGDLGCAGVDTEAWAEANRARVFPGEVNRWILARTLRDHPDPADVRGTLVAVMTKWFDGTTLDPALSKLMKPGENVAGTADSIRIERSSSEPLQFANRAEVVARRETLPMSPPPTLTSDAPVLFLEISFAYRGFEKDIPWPVRTAPGVFGSLSSTVHCPLDADWMLVEIAKPATRAAPRPDPLSSITDRASDVLKDTTKSATGFTSELLADTAWKLVGVALVASIGIYAVRKAAGR